MSEKSRLNFDECMSEFDRRGSLGEVPCASDFWEELDDEAREDFVDLIYREFVAREAAGQKPQPAEFIERYADWGTQLNRLFLAIGCIEEAFGDALRADITPALPAVGDSIGPFLLVEVLGRGAAAVVFKALQRDLANRAVVLKISSERISGGAAYQARVSHPNIMPVYRQFQTDDGQFDVTVMPFLEGASLDRLLKLLIESNPDKKKFIRRKLNLKLLSFQADFSNAANTGERSDDCISEWVGRWGISLAEALFEGYQAGVIHADIKPANIFIDKNGAAYLLDFHLARTWEFDRHRRVIRQAEKGGTIFYMPPERLKAILNQTDVNIADKTQIIQNANLQHRADLYALGLVLLDMMTLRDPADLRLKAKFDHWRDEAAALIQLRKDESWLVAWPGFKRLPKGWRVFFIEVLGPEPSARPVDGNAFAAKLRKVVESESVITKNRIFRKIQSNRRSAISVVILLFMIVSISGVNHQRNRSMEEVQKLWAVSDRLLVDPSETRETTLSFRMNQARKILDDETARHGWMTRDSMWRSLFVRSGDAMAAKLWFCGRIERLTNELQQRSRGSKSSEDQKAILLYLKQGLAIQNQQQWYNEAVAINQRLGNSDQIKRLQEPEEINAEIANYLTAIDQEKDDSKTTVEMLEKLSRQNPSQFVFHFELGRNLAIREEHAAAITNLEKAVELNLQSFEAKRLLAAEYFRNQQYQLADELTKMALRMRPDDISTLRLSVMIKFYFGQKNQLQDEIRRLEEIVLYDRGMKQVDQLPEKLDDAFDNEPANQVVFNLDTIDNLLKMIPEDPDLLKLKAKRLYLDNRHLESRIILEKLQQKSELSTFDLINLATLYHRENASRKSAELIRNAIERPDFERWFARNPNVRFLAHTAGESFEMHDLRVAREYYEKIIKINEMNKAHLGRFYFYLARCLIREDAQKNLESATNLLLKAGFQQSKYLYRWYQDEPVFDSVRSQIDPVLQASFAELSSDSQRDIELKSEKK